MGLGAAVSPVAVTLLITLMLRKHPLKNAFFFLVGYTGFLLTLGVVGVFLISRGTSGGKSSADAYIDVVLGVACLLVIPLAFRKKKKREPAQEIGPLKCMITGVVSMLVNSSTIVIFLAGTHEISKARLSTGEDLVAILILTAFTLVSLLVPVVAYALFPKTAAKVLDSVRVWLGKHSQWIAAGILLVFGVYLLVKGITAL